MKITSLVIKLLSCHTFVAALGVLFAVCTSNALAQSVGVQFVGAGGGGINNSSSDGLTPGQTAGAPYYAQSNWNNFGSYGISVPVTNSVGASTSLFMNWDSGGANTTGSSGLGTPDGNLLDGFIYSWGPGPASALGDSVYNTAINDKPLVYVSGINSWYQSEGAEGYSIVLYITGNTYYETSERWIQSVSGSPLADTMVGGPDLTPHLFDGDSANFGGTYIQVPATATNSANAYYGANYEVFTGLTNDAILIRNQCPSGYGGGLNGFQIVPVFPVAPTVTTPTFSPASPVYATIPVTVTEVATPDPFNPTLFYQWQTDGGGGGSLTNIPAATNSTVIWTPANSATTYNVNFDVIVSNSFGSSTSLVATLTVNPAVAPYITQDTTPGPGSSVPDVYAYLNSSVTFSAAFAGPPTITYQWQANTGSGYTNVIGATNTSLTLSNVQATVAGDYQLVASNPFGNTTSTPSILVTFSDPAPPTAGQPYDYAVMNDQPLAYWRLNETVNPAADSIQAYDFSGNNLDGTYGTNVVDDLAGPPYAGFVAGDTADSFLNGSASDWISMPNLNVNTNTVTFTAWILPQPVEDTYEGLLVWRGTNGDAAGFGFGSTLGPIGATGPTMAELGYTWNSNSASTYNYNSDLFPVAGDWSFVAVTITPTNSTIYLYYIDPSTGTNLLKSVQAITNSSEAFNGGTINLGSDNYAGRNFSGYINEVALFTHALSESQIQSLFLTAIGATGVAPTILTQPTSSSGYTGFAYQFSVTGSGAPDPTYQWQSSSSPSGPFSNINNGGRFSGATSPTLTISDTTSSDSIYYQVVLANASGTVTSSVANLNLIVVPTNGQFTVNYDAVTTAFGNPGNVYVGSGVLQGSGTYWNSIETITAPYSSATGLADNQSMDTGIRFTALPVPGNGLGTYSYFPLGPIYLLDGYINTTYQITSGGNTYDPTNTIELTNVPNGQYNLALYGVCGEWANRGELFSVNGVIHTIVQGPTATDTSFQEGVNTTVYTNVTVTGGTLNIGWWAYADALNPGNGDNAEGDFNGMQIQLIAGTASGNPAKITSAGMSGGKFNISGTSFDEGQGYHIVTSTNLLLPIASWTPVASGTFSSTGFSNSIPITPGVPARFYLVTEP